MDGMEYTELLDYLKENGKSISVSSVNRAYADFWVRYLCVSLHHHIEAHPPLYCSLCA